MDEETINESFERIRIHYLTDEENNEENDNHIIE